jgi:DNA mismatch repair protein MSH3
MVASIPVQRLHVHMRRLVSAGHKVGVVKQIETANLKATGDNKGGPFKRQLDCLYTKATLVTDEDDTVESTDSKFLIAVCDFAVGGKGLTMCSSSSCGGGASSAVAPNAHVHIAMIAIDIECGDVIYDDFEDDVLRSNLDSRLAHLSAVEFLLPQQMSDQTLQMLRTHAKNIGARVEVVSESHFDPADARGVVQKCLETHAASSSSSSSSSSSASAISDIISCDNEGTVGTLSTSSTAIATILDLPPPVLSPLAALMSHLSVFKLQGGLFLQANFWRFTSPAFMQLNRQAVQNLELLQGSDGTPAGSLVKLLDCTKTRFGSRLLRHWLTHPLLRLQDVSARHDAVEELAAGGSNLAPLTDLLPSLPDLDRMLLRAQYGRCKPQEVLQMLQSFRKIALAHARVLADPPTSSVLINVLRSMPDVGDVASALLSHLNVAAITKCDPDTPPLIPEFYKGIKSAQERVTAAKQALDDALPKIRTTLGMPGLK